MKCAEFPRAVEIQTVSACNARCVICPHPQASLDLPSGTMDMDLFCRIIDQVEPRWNCKVIPYLNSEPLLDKRLVERLRYISRSSASEIELSTNVAALTPEKQDLMLGIPITELRLSIFGFTESTHGRLMPGLRWEIVKKNLDHLTVNSSFRKAIDTIGVVMINHPLITDEDRRCAAEYCQKHGLAFNYWGFLDRAGNVAAYSNGINRSKIEGCEQRRPLERMHITFTGDVILCCQDWRWKNVIGNVRNQPLLDIWQGDLYAKYRDDIYGGHGNHPHVCARCKLSVPKRL